MTKRTTERLAIFDFDETLTLQDTTIRFLFFYGGYLKASAAFLLCIPAILLAWSGFANWVNVKERMFAFVFGGHDAETVKKSGDAFATDQIPPMLHPIVYEEMKKLKAAGYEILVLTASCRLWIEKWCEFEEAQLICTELEEEEGCYTGKLRGVNCYGAEKVTRLKEEYDLAQVKEIVAYGNLPPDIHYLKLAHKAFVVKGKNVLPL